MHGQQQSLRVSQQVINAQVKTQDGQQLGQIEDLIANPQTGRIEFAVVSKGDKLCPIPMQLLQPQQGSQGSSTTSTSGTTSGTSTTETTPGTPGTTSSTSPSYSRSGAQGQKVSFVAQVDRSKLEQAPSFSRTQWPEISQTWSQQIYSHFGVQPEAAGGTGSSSSSSQGKSSSSSSSSSDPSKSSSSSDTEKRSSEKSEN
jgi:sporulation protein YlmC with PRC-barrel domain